MNEQIALSFSVAPDQTTSLNLSVIPVMADGNIDPSGITSSLILGAGDDEKQQALVAAISAALATYLAD